MVLRLNLPKKFQQVFLSNGNLWSGLWYLKYIIKSIEKLILLNGHALSGFSELLVVCLMSIRKWTQKTACAITKQITKGNVFSSYQRQNFCTCNTQGKWIDSNRTTWIWRKINKQKLIYWVKKNKTNFLAWFYSVYYTFVYLLT